MSPHDWRQIGHHLDAWQIEVDAADEASLGLEAPAPAPVVDSLGDAPDRMVDGVLALVSRPAVSAVLRILGVR